MDSFDVNARGNVRPDLDAVPGIGGLVAPRFTGDGRGLEEEKENVDEELLDMVAGMPLYSQQQSQDGGKVAGGKGKPSLDEMDDIDMLLDMEEPVDGIGLDDDDDEIGGDVGNVDGYVGFFGEAETNTNGNDDVVHHDTGNVLNTADESAHEAAPPLPPESNSNGDIETTETVREDVIKNRECLPPQRDAMNATEQYITVTSPSGERVYAPLHVDDTSDGGLLARALRRSKGCLLSTKIDALLSAVEKDHFERVLAETQGRGQDTTRKMKKKEKKDQKASAAGTSGLWVDKYAPRHFMDLLSDELINRDVVKWMKQWDRCVFGTVDASKTSESTDPYFRPEQKLILLAGPPGLGKTTLAHIVARHCGYKAVEINASDERSGPELMSRVINAMEMTSVIGENRPNCIIIDEIDGVAAGGEGKSAVSALIKLAQAKVEKRSKHQEEDAGGKPSRKKKKDKPLTRPVICICNDLYAPVLRPLRDVARVFHVRPPSAEKLVERLQFICKREKLKAEKSTLRALIEKTECDIRSCLNTMQFIGKKQKMLRLSDISSVGSGQKDITIGAFRLWKDLLHQKKGPAVIGQVPESESQRCSRLFNTILDFGDHDLVIGGFYESLPSIIHFDMALLRTSTVLDNMQMADMLQRKLSQTADFSLGKYIPAMTLRIANILSGPENPSVRWPRTLPATRRELGERKAMLHRWMLGMNPSTYVTLGKTAAVAETIPLLPWLLSPSLRPVSRHLYSKEEKKTLERLVDAMLALGVSYSLEDDQDSDESNTAVKFNPPIHTFWNFPNKTLGQTCPPRDIPAPTQQMVAHELDMERIRRSTKSSQEGHQTQSTPSQVPKPTAAHIPVSLAQRLEENKASTPSKKKTSTRKRTWLDKLKSKQTTRGRSDQNSQGQTHSKKMRAEDMPVLYKFHEGYTNAVKKPIKIAQLL
ncbi:hypothetical protein M9435_003746 [Picochlorum sp. BPE23]|nr:hypothetical protein M9435_003746 [Picochlorum sp. BPE23]